MRTPLLVGGLIERHARIPIDELLLYDVDGGALDLVRGVSEAMLRRAGFPFRVRTSTSPDGIFDRARFVITSVRVGGLEGRAIDERVPLRYGVVGQETTGPGGWAMALRTVPLLTDLTETIGRGQAARPGTIINFTNPVGVVTQALERAAGGLAIGICDSPPALGRHIARALDVPPAVVTLDYLGLNHLGWVRAVRVDGEDRLGEILASDDLLRRIYGRPLFEPRLLRRLGLLPNEYLRYYYYHDEVVARLRKQPQTRGEALFEVAASLRSRVAGALERGDDPIPDYMAAILARRSSYMAAETGQRRDLAMMGGRVEGGYAQAALDVIEALLLRGPEELIVNTANRGAIGGLRSDDIVEVPSGFATGAPLPRDMGELPEQVRDLVLRVKDYERVTAQAAAERSWSMAVDALAVHPLVPSREIAAAIAGDYRRMHSPHLDYLK